MTDTTRAAAYGRLIADWTRVYKAVHGREVPDHITTAIWLGPELGPSAMRQFSSTDREFKVLQGWTGASSGTLMRRETMQVVVAAYTERLSS